MTNNYNIPEYRDDDDYGQAEHANTLLEEWRQCLEKQYELENLLQCGFINNED